MLHLLQLEISKFKKNAVVKMLLWIYLIAFPTVIFTGKEESMLPPMINSRIFFEFPTVWEWLGYSGNWLVFFCLGFIIVYIISIEGSYKTMRQNIITGMSRSQYLWGKYQVVISLALLATVYYIIAGMVIGWLSTEGATFSSAMENDWAFARFFLMSLGYLTIAYFIGFMIQNSGLAVLTYLAYGIILEPMIRWLGHAQLVEDKTSMNYYPMNAMEDLMPLPFYKMPAMNSGENLTLLLNYKTAAIISVISIVVCLVITYLVFRRKDI